jgi:CelD/BcsL family acetyltransferase involved in cellulose biosynthesis
MVPSRGASRRGLAASVPARICVTSDVRDFAGVWPCSSNLGEARCYAFHCANLVELLCDTVVPARKAEPLLVAILNQNDEPLALLPLCIEHHHDTTRAVMDVRVLKFLDGGLSDYNAPVLFPAAANWDARTVRTIWRGLRKALPVFDVAVLEKMPESVGDLPNPLRFLKCEPEVRFGHAANLSEAPEALPTFLGERKLRQKVRGLSQRGRLTFEIAKTPEQYDIFVDALIRQKNRRDLELRDHESLRALGYTPYLRMARRHLHPSGPVCLFALMLDDSVLATHFCETSGHRLSSLFTSFEAEWSKYSPGHILNRHIVQWCLSEGVNILDFGGGDEKWKDDYHAVAITRYKAIIPSTIRGTVFLHTPGIVERVHKRRAESWREMALAEAACSNPGEVSGALAHARRSWTLWPSPGRTREFLNVAKSVRATKSGRTI